MQSRGSLFLRAAGLCSFSVCDAIGDQLFPEAKQKEGSRQLVLTPKLRHHGAVGARPALQVPLQHLGTKALGEGSLAREVGNATVMLAGGMVPDPRSTIVTGISSGALMATFALLGTAGDDRTLQTLFTNFTASDIFTWRGLLNVVFGANALLYTTPIAYLRPNKV